jgi:tetratricopeptide (TPR) repeat protein
MFTVLEVIPLKASFRRHSSILGGLALSLSAALPVAAAAQTKPGDDAQRILVVVFQSADKALGAKAATAVRDKLAKEYNPRDTWVIPTVDINNTLGASGYPTDEALGASDARQLAVQVRADQFIDGSVTQIPTGYRIEPRVVLSRDASLAQSLAPAEAASLDKAASIAVSEIKDARRQLAGELACYKSFREAKYDAAVAAARKAVNESPNGTLAAICLGNAYGALKNQDSVQAIGERIIARDPRNIPALTWLAEIYRTKNDPKRLDVLTALLAADPTNISLQQQVVNELAQSGQAAKAIPFVTTLIQNNPADPQILHTGWLIYLAAKDYDRALQVGQELIRVDTAAADTTYYIRTAGVYSALNRAADAATTLQAGALRFPNNATLSLAGIQGMIKAGRTAEAATAARKILATDPKNVNANVLLIQALSNPDEISAAINAAITAGADPSILSQLALQQASTAINAAQQSKARADYQRALTFAQLSDRLATSVDAKYIAGLSAYFIGEGAITDAVKTKNCSLARMAQDNFAIVQTTLPAAGRAHPSEATQILGAVGQYAPSVSQAVKQYCK